jgi:membrane fusion protein (multidrug efflux system)
LEAQKKLFKTGSISRARLNRAEIDYQQALLEYKTALEDLKSLTAKSKRGRLEGEVKVAKARADLEEIQATLEKCIIKAPISGIVAEKRKWTGEKTGPNDSVIVTILQTREVYADVELNEQKLAEVNVGQEAEVRADAYPGQIFNGKVHMISPTIETKSRTVRVRVKVSNARQLLKPGMFARVTLILDKIENALVVPAEAVMRTKEGRQVVFVIIDNVAFLREVQIGLQKENWIEIRKGVKIGEQVVVEGKERLRDLSSVQIAESGAI